MSGQKSPPPGSVFYGPRTGQKAACFSLSRANNLCRNPISGLEISFPYAQRVPRQTQSLSRTQSGLVRPILGIPLSAVLLLLLGFDRRIAKVDNAASVPPAPSTVVILSGAVIYHSGRRLRRRSRRSQRTSQERASIISPLLSLSLSPSSKNICETRTNGSIR